jgi:hypothetical protein
MVSDFYNRVVMLESILDSLPIEISHYDSNGLLVYANKCFKGNSQMPPVAERVFQNTNHIGTRYKMTASSTYECANAVFSNDRFCGVVYSKLETGEDRFKKSHRYNSLHLKGLDAIAEITAFVPVLVTLYRISDLTLLFHNEEASEWLKRNRNLDLRPGMKLHEIVSPQSVAIYLENLETVRKTRKTLDCKLYMPWVKLLASY